MSAAGNAAKGGPQLTPVEVFEAGVAAANLLGRDRHKIEDPPIPSAVFTQPPLAAVGLREDKAKKQGFHFETRHAHTSEWFSSRRVNEPSAFKVLIELETERILGAHLLGRKAHELINLFALAMRAG